MLRKATISTKRKYQQHCCNNAKNLNINTGFTTSINTTGFDAGFMHVATRARTGLKGSELKVLNASNTVKHLKNHYQVQGQVLRLSPSASAPISASSSSALPLLQHFNCNYNYRPSKDSNCNYNCKYKYHTYPPFISCSSFTMPIQAQTRVLQVLPVRRNSSTSTYTGILMNAKNSVNTLNRVHTIQSKFKNGETNPNTNMNMNMNMNTNIWINSSSSNSSNSFNSHLHYQHQHQHQRRFFSNNTSNGNNGSTVTGWESSSSSSNASSKIIESGNASNASGSNTSGEGAEVILGLDRKRLLVLFGFITTVSSIIAAPVILR